MQKDTPCPKCSKPMYRTSKICLECYRKSYRGPRKYQKTNCPQGHEYTRENTYTDKRGYRYCRACQLAAQHKAYVTSAERRESVARQGRRTSFSKYGITEEEFKSIMQVQGGVCAGCGKQPAEHRRLDVDHKHQRAEKKALPETRRPLVRGALCHRCNRALGYLLDNSNTLRNLAEYIDHPPAKSVIQ